MNPFNLNGSPTLKTHKKYVLVSTSDQLVWDQIFPHCLYRSGNIAIKIV